MKGFQYIKNTNHNDIIQNTITREHGMQSTHTHTHNADPGDVRICMTECSNDVHALE